MAHTRNLHTIKRSQKKIDPSVHANGSELNLTSKLAAKLRWPCKWTTSSDVDVVMIDRSLSDWDIIQ